MEGYVIVYRPGGDVYQMLSADYDGTGKDSLKMRVLKTVAKALITGLQIWWTLKR